MLTVQSSPMSSPPTVAPESPQPSSSTAQLQDTPRKRKLRTEVGKLRTRVHRLKRKLITGTSPRQRHIPQATAHPPGNGTSPRQRHIPQATAHPPGNGTSPRQRHIPQATAHPPGNGTSPRQRHIPQATEASETSTGQYDCHATRAIPTKNHCRFHQGAGNSI